MASTTATTTRATLTSTLFDSACTGDLNGVRRLIGGKEVVDVNENSKTKHGMTPLHIACERRHLSVIRYLVETADANIHVMDRDGWTPLHVVCASDLEENRLAVVKYLIKQGGSVHTRNKNGSTPLHFACFSRNISFEMIQYLVEHCGAKVNVKSRFGTTPLHLAYKANTSSEQKNKVIHYLLTKVHSVDRDILYNTWEGGHGTFSWDMKEMVLEKYALGQRIPVQAFRKLPLHTILKRRFPLPSKQALVDCIKHYDSAASTADFHGRLAIHVALSTTSSSLSQSRQAITTTHLPMIVSTLATLEPRSLLSRDPTTGMYPHETIMMNFVSSSDKDDNEWLNVLYEIVRNHPAHIL